MTTVIAILATALAAAPAGSSKAESSPNSVPVVVEAAAAFYPRDARIGGIEGSVRLSVSTDGNRVSDVRVLGGSPILAVAAVANVKSWRLAPGRPAQFETTFRYRLWAESDCSLDTGESVMELPTRVEVRARRVHTCDPVREISR